MPRPKSAKRKSSSQLEDTQQSDGDESSIGDDDDDDDDDEQHGTMSFTQQAPELSQGIFPVKPSEQKNLESMKPEQREKALMDLSRLILFKALAGEPIDRLKCCRDAGLNDGKISSAAFAEVAERLENVFGFELKRFPKWMQNYKSIPKKFTDRHYMVKSNVEDTNGMHTKNLYTVHAGPSVEKGFLMVVLALVFCKGEPRSDSSRWILDADLYRLLNLLDEHLPAEPPALGNNKKKAGGRRRQVDHDGDSGVAMTPNVDELLEKFVRLDYLLKDKISEERLMNMNGTVDENSFVYALGPRAAIEIGRKQIIFFCAEILDEEPDPTMLMEIERDDELEEQMEGDDE